MKIRENREVLLHFTPFKKMFILGKKDPVLDYESLISQIKNTKVELVEFPDGHMSHIENKDEFLRKIMHFVEN
jgi:pimeloyl-ACP methyl ester carboxylesterase